VEWKRIRRGVASREFNQAEKYSDLSKLYEDLTLAKRQRTYSDQTQTRIQSVQQPSPLGLCRGKPASAFHLQHLHIELNSQAQKYENEKLLESDTAHIYVCSFHLVSWQSSRTSHTSADNLDDKSDEIKTDE